MGQGQGQGYNVGSPGSGLRPAAWEPGSPRSHAKNPGLAPSSWVLHSAPASTAGRSARGTQYRDLSTPAPPGSMGACSSLGVVVGEYLPAMWAPGTWAG